MAIALKSTSPVIIKADITFNPASIPANSSADQTVTVAGLLPGYPVHVWAEALENGVVISHAWCSAINTMKMRLANCTVGAIDPASQVFRVVQR
jgi:hypothetical protein